MAVFSTNQAKHLYIAKAFQSSSLSSVGDITVGKDADNCIYFKYKGNDGVVRSDLIKIDNITSIKAVKATDMLKYQENAYIGCSAAVAGQNYILKITIPEFIGMSSEDKGFIFADYQAKSGDTVQIILANLAVNLAKNVKFAAANDLFKIYVTTQASGSSKTVNSNTWLVTPNSSVTTLSASSLIGIIIEGAAQPWSLGKYSADKVYFTVAADSIKSSGIDTSWLTVAYNASTNSINGKITNSKLVADLEYFCMGERGDIYRGVGFPNNFDFKPLANPEATYGYHMLNIEYFYAGDAEDVQKSPREIIIAVPAEGDTTYTVMDSIIGSTSSSGSLNYALGANVVSTLGTPATTAAAATSAAPANNG